MDQTNKDASDIYSPEIVSEIAEMLGVDDQYKISQLKDLLEHQADGYFWSIARNDKKHTFKQELAEWERLSRSLNKSKKILSSLIGQGTSFRLHGALKDSSNLSRAAICIRENVYHDYIAQTSFITDILEELEAISARAADENNKYVTASKSNDTTALVLNWLYMIMDFWFQNSDIHISEGKDGYVSPSMKILNKMVKPINDNLTYSYRNKYEITHSKLAQAIIKYRKSIASESVESQ